MMEIGIISSLGLLWISCCDHLHRSLCIDIWFCFSEVYRRGGMAGWYSKFMLNFVRNWHAFQSCRTNLHSYQQCRRGWGPIFKTLEKRAVGTQRPLRGFFKSLEWQLSHNKGTTWNVEAFLPLLSSCFPFFPKSVSELLLPPPQKGQGIGVPA